MGLYWQGWRVYVRRERNGFLTGSVLHSFIPADFHTRVLVSVKKVRTVTITLDREMSFSVLLHRVWKKHPTNVDFLGIYIPPTNKFSPNAHGLLGKVPITNLATMGPLWVMSSFDG